MKVVLKTALASGMLLALSACSDLDKINTTDLNSSENHRHERDLLSSSESGENTLSSESHENAVSGELPVILLLRHICLSMSNYL